MNQRMHADHQPLYLAETRGNATVRVPVQPLSSSGQFTIQVAFGVLNPITSGNAAAGVPCSVLDYVIGTPGMYLDY